MKLGLYKHHKGNYYEVIALARSSETTEEMVVYRALYDSKEFGHYQVWVRPKQMFEECIKNSIGNSIPRFEYIGEKLTTG